MAKTTAAGAGNQIVGKVFILYGTVKAVAYDGTVRILAPNSPIYADDRIITGADGSISLQFDGPPVTQLDLGRMTEIVIDEGVYAGVTPEVVTEASADAEKIQEALLAGDEEIDLEATAAGGDAGAGGGHSVVIFDLDGNEVMPGSGAETTGISMTSVDPLAGVVAEPIMEALAVPPTEPEEVVTKVANPPFLMMSVGTPEIKVTVIEGEIPPPITIPVSFTATNIYAYADVDKIDLKDLKNMDAEVSDAGKGNGIGVLSENEGHGLGAKSIKPGEGLVIDLEGDFESAVVTFKHSQHDDIRWDAYDEDGNKVGSGSIPHGSGNEGWIVATIDPGSEFSYLVISGGEVEGTSQLGFTLFSIVAMPEPIDSYEYTYIYPLTIEAAVNDLDGGSEVLGPVIIPVNSVPDGATIEGADLTLSDDGNYYLLDIGPEGGTVTLSLYSSAMLTDEQINSIYGSVTSTETGEGGVIVEGDPATTTANALIELIGTDANDMLTGSDADELVRGGEGDDILVGGGGEDVISGGAGADTFDQADYDAGKVVDFNADEGDTLANLVPEDNEPA